MKLQAILYSLCALLCQTQASEPAKLYVDTAHGGINLDSGAQAALLKKLGVEVIAGTAPITIDALAGSKALYLRAPTKPFTDEEKTAIVAFVKGGGSLCIVFDEEKRMPLAKIGVNEMIAPFGMKLTADTPYLHNTGAVAKAGEIHKADREIPYSGGRAVEGGDAFAFQLDKEGEPAQPFAASKLLGNGARIVVMAEGMASLFLGTAKGNALPAWTAIQHGPCIGARTARSSCRKSLSGSCDEPHRCLCVAAHQRACDAVIRDSSSVCFNPCGNSERQSANAILCESNARERWQ